MPECRHVRLYVADFVKGVPPRGLSIFLYLRLYVPPPQTRRLTLDVASRVTRIGPGRASYARSSPPSMPHANGTSATRASHTAGHQACVLRFLHNVGVRYLHSSRAPANSAKTLSKALSWLRAWGFLTWQRRICRVQTALGTAVRQASNAYRIALSGLAATGAKLSGGAPMRNNRQPSQSPTNQPTIFGQDLRGAGKSPGALHPSLHQPATSWHLC